MNLSAAFSFSKFQYQQPPMNSLHDLLKRCAVIAPDGRMLRLNINIEDLGVRDDLLLKAAGEAAGVPLLNLCSMPNTNPPMQVHMFAAANIGMAVRIPMLRMNTFWAVEEQAGEPVIVPKFQEGETMDRTLDWTPPEGCAIYLVVRNSTPYLIALGQHPERGHWRAIRLDLPNLFTDARVCMGNNWVNPETGSYVDRLRKYIDSIFTSRWNTHLMGADGDNHARWETSKKLVRFTPEGKVLPPLVPWYNCGKEVSHTAYNWLVSMAQARRGAP